MDTVNERGGGERVIRICVAGATGWVGRSLTPAVEAAPDLELSGAVSRSAAGRPLGEAVPGCTTDLLIRGTVAEALDGGADVLIDYTSPSSAKAHTLTAIERGVHVVIGTSGLTEEDYAEIDAAASAAGVGVLAAGNFAITAVLLQRFAEMAAAVLPAWEILDYADARKPDAPSGTVRELVSRISRVARPEVAVPVEATEGERACRGATMGGIQVHSVRVPGIVIGAEVIFGAEGERLSLRFDGGSSAAPYVEGTLVAARHVAEQAGLRRGLDQVLSLGGGAE